VDPEGLLTGGIGYDYTVAVLGWGFKLNVQRVWDIKGGGKVGDTGLAITFGWGGYADAAGASLTGTGGITTASSINNLAGTSLDVGAGLTIPI